ncbi:MAG: c-type cytochrome [Sphingomicrobium sp.]
MKDRQNTINGWVLFAGVVALGASIVAGEVFHSERPEKMGYPIEGVEVEGEGAEAAKPIEFYLAAADATKGEQVFKKCAACHNADKGGANALGPNLWGVLGEPVGKGHGFAFSEALASKGGAWDWNNLSEWLSNPKKFAPGTKMTFAGLSNPEDRANVIAFLNAHSDAPRPLPAAPAETAEAAGDKAAAEAEGAGAQKAANEPVLNEAQAAKGGRTLAGEAAPGEAVKPSR